MSKLNEECIDVLQDYANLLAGNCCTIDSSIKKQVEVLEHRASLLLNYFEARRRIEESIRDEDQF